MPPIRPGYQENKYTILYKCSNCNHENAIYILKGELAPKHSSQPCKYCGCKTLIKK